MFFCELPSFTNLVNALICGLGQREEKLLAHVSFLTGLKEDGDTNFRQSWWSSLFQLYARTSFLEHLDRAKRHSLLLLAEELVRAKVAQAVLPVGRLIKLVAQIAAQELDCPVEVQLEAVKAVLRSLKIHNDCAIIFCVI